MTNRMIIELYKIEHNITCPMHTYAKWQELGYQVKKGEKSKHKITIWKGCTKKVKNEKSETMEETSKLFEEKFPESEGYKLNVTRWETAGTPIIFKNEIVEA